MGAASVRRPVSELDNMVRLVASACNDVDEAVNDTRAVLDVNAAVGSTAATAIKTEAMTDFIVVKLQGMDSANCRFTK